MEKFWIVWNPRWTSDGRPTVRYEAHLAARVEAARRAVKNPGQKFYVMQAIGAATRTLPVVEWDEPSPF